MVSTVTLQESFVSYLPYMRSTARFAFQRLSPDHREEAVSNTLSLAWKAFARLNELGRADEPGVLRAIIWYSVKQTRAGRKIDSAAKPRDPLALRAQGKATCEPWDLADYVSRETPILDAVSFRLDVPAFLATLTERQRNLALDLATSMSTTDAARKHNRSAGAISQFRLRFKKLFDEFFAE